MRRSIVLLLLLCAQVGALGRSACLPGWTASVVHNRIVAATVDGFVCYGTDEPRNVPALDIAAVACDGGAVK